MCSQEEWNSAAHLRHFSAVRKLDNQPFPAGAGCVLLAIFTSLLRLKLQLWAASGSADQLGRYDRTAHAGFDGEVRKANQSDIGRRNGGAMLSMQVGPGRQGVPLSS